MLCCTGSLFLKKESKYAACMFLHDAFANCIGHAA